MSLKYYNYDIVFQEVPDEVSLAINLTNCPNHCADCHSPHLWEDTGTELTFCEMDSLVARYAGSITCVCLMGGDADRQSVERMATYIRQTTGLKVAWYSGRTVYPSNPHDFDYLKLGPFLPDKGSLRSRTTNQHLYRREGDDWHDITSRFWR
ncbi:MAG: anaerobic ribonucleoside-triphosphate reductase activating protein [Bacteroidales bacterium]|nr:anaerobic ribonucleoside-triphosphate reductase activating protein [Bacteroidales bacterium]